MPHFVRVLGAVLLTLAGLGSTASVAQSTNCPPDWLPAVGSLPTAEVKALTTYDSGTGPEVYVGGWFTNFRVPGGNNLVKWNGTSWSTVGGGLSSGVTALAVGDIGAGPRLFAAGFFTSAGGTPVSRIAQWDGTSWSSLGTGLPVPEAMCVHDDGTGPALFIGGLFSSVNGVAVNNLAKWNGTTWSAVGLGTNSEVRALTRFNFGSGTVLVAGGGFTTAGGISANRVARWNGTSWSAVGTTLNTGTVYSLAVYNPGSGPALYASGTFFGNLRVWTGTTWSSSPGSFNALVSDLIVFDDGVQSALIASGIFTTVNSLPIKRIAQLVGTQWSALGGGVGAGPDAGGLEALAVGNLGSGPRLFVGGNIEWAGNAPAYRFAEWSGAGWSSPPCNGISGWVEDLEVFDDGSGEALYVGGQFRTLNEHLANYIARWNGTGWSTLSTGLNASINAICGHDDGTGPALYVGGWISQAGSTPVNRIARWRAGAWEAVGAGLPTAPELLESFDDGTTSLLFASVGAGAGLQAWNGTSWTAFGLAGVGARALKSFDDGSGLKLYMSAYFTPPGQPAGEYVARWNGTTWEVVGALNFLVTSLAVYDDGSGPALYAGGEFSQVDLVPASGVAKWNGTSWSALGSGISESGSSGLVRAMTVLTDDQGPVLYCAGWFDTAGGQPANNMAKWNGTSWSALGPGLPFWASDLAVFDPKDCRGPQLFVGGAFTNNSVGDTYLARWGCPSTSVAFECDSLSFCFGDGQDPALTTPCPCSNFGAPGHGCANSVQPAGALLTRTGPANPDQVVLSASGMPATVTCIYLQGTALGDATFGDGVRCSGGVLLRLRTRANVGGASQFPDSTDTVTLSQRGGVVPGSGAVRYYQTYYRNAASAFCPPETYNVTNGVRITW
ncbi:MAG: hypothetical protein IPJ77_22800 [Planctomycetes bacterium]|nr:hypothetical protein [Planctomycetota bacterium]